MNLGNLKQTMRNPLLGCFRNGRDAVKALPGGKKISTTTKETKTVVLSRGEHCMLHDTFPGMTFSLVQEWQDCYEGNDCFLIRCEPCFPKLNFILVKAILVDSPRLRKIWADPSVDVC